MISRPAKPPHVIERLRPHRTGFPAPVRRAAKTMLASASDRGWFGLTPLDTHVVICGFPRSGTTLLLLIAEASYPHAKTFHRERFALRAAADHWLGRHSLMFTKKPDDIYWIDEIRECYQSKRTRTRFITCVRDPRAVLTSIHARQEGYYVTPERWRSIYDHFRYAQQFDDVMTVRFEDLVREPIAVQRRASEFIGSIPERPFDQFHDAVPSEFRTLALSGVRPLEADAIDKWKAPQHRQRIRMLVEEMPELPRALVDLGYEQDHSWTTLY
jgi:hypothetical protein